MSRKGSKKRDIAADGVKTGCVGEQNETRGLLQTECRMKMQCGMTWRVKREVEGERQERQGRQGRVGKEEESM